ncbi:MAG TPA: CHASE3 domain-containing protein, partial [Lacunisphaera sp.]|nr:CHASE3 domain-containing protein [Lacunisphaera sp.]
MTWQNWLRLNGVILMSIGWLSLAGRATGLVGMTAVFPGSVPMVANAAVCLILLGAGMVALGMGRPLLTRWAGAAVVGLAGLVGMQGVFGIALGIDELLFAHTFAPPQPHPGRMVPGTVMAFMLAGGILVELSRRKRRLATVAMLVGLVVGVALLGLVSHVTDLHLAAVGGGISLHMAPGAAIGVMLLAVTALAGNPVNLRQPLALMVAILLTAVGLFAYRLHEEKTEVDQRLAAADELMGGVTYVELCLTRAESAVRHYVISGDERQLDHVADLQRRLRVELNHLEALTFELGAQQENIGRFRTLVAARQENLRHLTELRRSGNHEAATGLVTAGEGFRRMQTVRSHVNLIADEVREERARSAAEVVRVSRETTRSIVVGNILAGALAFAALYLSRRHELERIRVEKKLVEANRLQRAVLDGSVFSVIATEPDGLIREFNAGAERMLGYRREELVGWRTPEVLHLPGEMVARAAELGKRSGRPVAAGFGVVVAPAREGRADEREWTYVRKDGRHLPVQLSVTAMRNESGAITGFLAIAQDLTDRKRAEDAVRVSQERLSQVLGHA